MRAPAPEHVEFRGPRELPVWVRLLVAVIVAPGVATGLAMLLPSTRPGVAGSLYLLATIGATLLAGFWAAVVASVLSVLALDYFFISPAGVFRPRGPDDLVLLGVFLISAAVVARVVDHIQVREQAALEAATRTRAMLALSSGLSEALDVEAVSRTTLGSLSAIFPIKAGAVWVGEGPNLTAVGQKGYPPKVMERYGTVPLSADLPNTEPARTGRAILLRTAAERAARFPDLAEARQEIGGGALAALPLAVEGRLVGSLTMNFHRDHRFDAADLEVMEAVADQCALAMERVRLAEKDRVARERVEFLGEASRILGGSLDYEKTLQEVASLAVPTFADWSSVDLVDEDGGLQLVAVAHTDPGMVEWARDLRERHPPEQDAPRGAPNVIRTGRSELYAEVPSSMIDRADLDDEQREAVRRLALRSVMVVPLAARDQVLGALTLVYAEGGRRYDHEDLEMAEDLGRRAATAIDNARLHQAEAQARERLSVLSTASRLLASSLDYEATVAKAASLAVDAMADFSILFMAEPGGSLRAVAGAHRDPAKEDLVRRWMHLYQPDPENPQSVLMKAVRTAQPQLVPNVEEANLQRLVQAPEQLEAFRELRTRAGLVVPLVMRDSVIGVLSLARSESDRPFGPTDIELAEELARRMARAIENARLYRERDHMARTLQQSLLPQSLPAIAGLELAARYLPAGEGNEVGGDFYDVFQAADDTWLIMVGDVCGKGAEAAAVMGMARHTLRALALHETRPSTLLESLNEAMLAQRDDLRFCTVACARVRLGPGGVRLTVGSAGHPLPMVVRRDGRVHPAASYGTLLGVFPDIAVRDELVDLEAGDALVFYTDGVEDRRASAEDRVMSAMQSSTSRTAVELADAIVACASPLDRTRADDLAVVALRVVP